MLVTSIYDGDYVVVVVIVCDDDDDAGCDLNGGVRCGSDLRENTVGAKSRDERR